MYYPCSENKGADQLCSYCTADLRLCFRKDEMTRLICYDRDTCLHASRDRFAVNMA